MALYWFLLYVGKMSNKNRKITENILKVKKKIHLRRHIHWQVNYGWFCPLSNIRDDNYSEHQTPLEKLPYPRSLPLEKLPYPLRGPHAVIPLNETLVHCRSRLLLSQNLKPAKYSQNICPTLCPKSPPENPSSTQACLEGSFWGAKSWGTGRYAQRGLPERNQLRFTSQKKWGFFYSKLQNVVWLIRAIINGNIIIQASISKRSHLNEYIFCLGAVAASEPLKRKEKKRKGTKRKETEEAAGVKPWRMRLKELSVGNWESRVPAGVSGLTPVCTLWP